MAFVSVLNIAFKYQHGVYINLVRRQWGEMLKLTDWPSFNPPPPTSTAGGGWPIYEMSARFLVECFSSDTPKVQVAGYVKRVSHYVFRTRLPVILNVMCNVCTPSQALIHVVSCRREMITVPTYALVRSLPLSIANIGSTVLRLAVRIDHVCDPNLHPVKL